MFKLNQTIIKNKVLTWSRDLTPESEIGSPDFQIRTPDLPPTSPKTAHCSIIWKVFRGDFKRFARKPLSCRPEADSDQSNTFDR